MLKRNQKSPAAASPAARFGGEKSKDSRSKTAQSSPKADQFKKKLPAKAPKQTRAIVQKGPIARPVTREERTDTKSAEINKKVGCFYWNKLYSSSVTRAVFFSCFTGEKTKASRTGGWTGRLWEDGGKVQKETDERGRGWFNEIFQVVRRLVSPAYSLHFFALSLVSLAKLCRVIWPAVGSVFISTVVMIVCRVFFFFPCWFRWCRLIPTQTWIVLFFLHSIITRKKWKKNETNRTTILCRRNREVLQFFCGCLCRRLYSLKNQEIRTTTNISWGFIFIIFVYFLRNNPSLMHFRIMGFISYCRAILSDWSNEWEGGNCRCVECLIWWRYVRRERPCSATIP